MSKKSVLNIGVVCGEHSGDRLGAGLIKEIKETSEINLYGIGGPKLEGLGFKSEFDFSEINVILINSKSCITSHLVIVTNRLHE